MTGMDPHISISDAEEEEAALLLETLKRGNGGWEVLSALRNKSPSTREALIKEIDSLLDALVVQNPNDVGAFELKNIANLVEDLVDVFSKDERKRFVPNLLGLMRFALQGIPTSLRGGETMVSVKDESLEPEMFRTLNRLLLVAKEEVELLNPGFLELLAASEDDLKWLLDEVNRREVQDLALCLICRTAAGAQYFDHVIARGCVGDNDTVFQKCLDGMGPNIVLKIFDKLREVREQRIFCGGELSNNERYLQENLLRQLGARIGDGYDRTMELLGATRELQQIWDGLSICIYGGEHLDERRSVRLGDKIKELYYGGLLGENLRVAVAAFCELAKRPEQLQFVSLSFIGRPVDEVGIDTQISAAHYITKALARFKSSQS